MKNLLLISVIVFIALNASAQGINDLSTSFNLYFYDKTTGQGYAGADAAVSAMYKDADDNLLYSEIHQGTIDENTSFRIAIGKGIPQEGDLNEETISRIASLCWNASLIPPGGSTILLQGEVTVLPTLIASQSRQSINSSRLGGYSFNASKANVTDLLGSNKETQWNFMVNRQNLVNQGEGEFNLFHVNDFITSSKLPSAVTGTDVDVVNIGSGLKCAMNFSKIPLTSLENQYTLCVNDLSEFYHALAVVNKGIRSSEVTHNTASIYAENNSPDLGAGVLARAGTWGVFASAANGAVGISSGTVNGSGVWGTASEPPASGGYKYAVLGTTNSFADTWAAAFFGSGFYTGTWSMSSDERFKTGIRSQTNALDKIMKLKPAVYQYRQDMPYGFPDGLHYGFVAQDMEEVLPELVSDISMPKNLDSQSLHKSGAEEYKAINYIEIISILTSALQELNETTTAKLEAQAKEIEELRAAVKALQE